MKRISILLILIIILVFNVSLVIVNGDTINTNEYDAYKIYDSSTKVIIDDNQVVPDVANILLISEDGNYIVSVTKEERNKLKEYKIIGYSVDGKNYIYNSGNKLISNINYYTFKGKNVKIPYFSLLVIAFSILILTCLTEVECNFWDSVIMLVVTLIISYFAFKYIFPNVMPNAIKAWMKMKIKTEVTYYIEPKGIITN